MPLHLTATGIPRMTRIRLRSLVSRGDPPGLSSHFVKSIKLTSDVALENMLVYSREIIERTSAEEFEKLRSRRYLTNCLANFFMLCGTGFSTILPI